MTSLIYILYTFTGVKYKAFRPGHTDQRKAPLPGKRRRFGCGQDEDVCLLCHRQLNLLRGRPHRAASFPIAAVPPQKP